MKSYLELLEGQAADAGITMMQAFKAADVPRSTYYRTINGETELRHETAKRVADAIEKLQALHAAREHTRKLRANGERVNPRTIRARLKSGSFG